MQAHAVERVLGEGGLVVDGELVHAHGIVEDGDHRRTLPGEADVADRVLEQFAHLRRLGDGLDARAEDVRGRRAGRRRGRGHGGHVLGLIEHHQPPRFRDRGGRIHRGQRGASDPRTSFRFVRALVHRRLERGVLLGHHQRAGDIKRLIQILLERNRPPAHEAQLDVVPIVVGLVVHDGPTLECAFGVLVDLGGLIVRQDETVARLPHGRFHDVPEPDPPFARAVEVDFHGLLVLVTRPGDGGQRAVEFLL